MSPTMLSLLAVTIGFTGLVIWVYWPSNRKKLESLGQIPLDPEGDEELDKEYSRTETGNE